MELTIEEKIKYSGISARILIATSVIFIGYGAVVKITQDPTYGNMLMGTGLVFCALFAVAVYVKKTLEQRIESGKTFHGGKS